MAKKRVEMPRLVNAKPEHYFVLVTGVPLKNLKELAYSLENMNDWVFCHHVNESRNDFANWVKDILREDTLAKELYGMNDKYAMEIKILRYMVEKYTG